MLRADQPIRLKGKKMEQLRKACYERDGRRCTWVDKGKRCGRWLRWESGFLDSFHMAHIVSRGPTASHAGGSDTIDNVRALCAIHHAIEHSNGCGLAAMHF